MDYRSPLLTMQRELASLEEELASLRALPDAQPKVGAHSKKAKAKIERRSRALQSELARLENQIAKRKKDLGYRSLTAREAKGNREVFWLGIASALLGLAIFGVDFGLSLRTASIWRETACRLHYEDDSYVASYVVAGKTYDFYPGAERHVAEARCFVPSPPLAGIGRMDPPATSVVPLRSKLSIGWGLGAGIAFAFGVTMLAISRIDRGRRERGEIAADDFDDHA